LTYTVVHEETRYTRRTEIKQITDEMVVNVRKHKTVQDEQIRRNTQLRDQLLQLKKQLAQA
jgi:hypothetical protein